MRLLFLGDIVGRAGRSAVIGRLPALRTALRLDAVVANAENAAHGFGLTAKIYHDLLAAGVDVVTTGNHVFDQKELLAQIDELPRLLRPINLPPGAPGRGAVTVTLTDGRALLVVNALGRLFMEAVDDPFQTIEPALQRAPLGARVQAAVIDFHAEATSEKQSLAQLHDGRASLIVGTHTHTPSADTRILARGTAYQTDAGMCGDYDSVIGFEPEAPVHRFLRRLPGPRLTPAEGEATLCGVFVETDDATGLARRVAPFREGPHLRPTPLADFG